ncbi:glycosyltransferase family 2 protein [Bifidobacterium sp. ESL0745]|uniref:glycosyltransferase family 2 protein n=1 Tax=Bifidobacterium sp. ESL0745 TaxID=2983226 RepID=UPI0023F9E1BE|nr:glycosyltransferase family 2 protein [Bifidobacterium sp. ESL0745]MDF7665583.1 glycosyltransferase family 2 protein [Bifidobacterium sp. ESL0745]
MDQTPLVTIVIPAYNVAEYIDECIASATNQTYKNLQVVIVDDGSTDNTFERCNVLAQADSRICLIHEDNAGLASARNKGIESARGKYIMLLDGDDTIRLTAVEKLVQCATLHNSDLVVFDLCAVDSQTGELLPRTVMNPLPFPQIKQSNGEGCLHQIYSGHIGNYAPGFFYRREIFEKGGFRFSSDVLFLEDVNFVNSILPHIERIAYLSEPLYIYKCNRSGSLTNSKSVKQVRSAFSMLQRVITERKNTDADFPNYAVNLLFFLISCLPSLTDSDSKSLYHEVEKAIIGLSSSYFSRFDSHLKLKVLCLDLHLYPLFLKLHRKTRTLRK